VNFLKRSIQASSSIHSELLPAFVLYQAKKFEDFQNNFKYKPVSGDVHDKSENESFLESVSSVVPLHVQETTG